MNTKGWWKVTTGVSGSEIGEQYLGVFYGHVDEIAFRLADKQTGFWCDGKLTFQRVEKATLPKIKNPKSKVNVEILGINWKNGPDLIKKSEAFFKSRPVQVSDCSQYAAITLSRKSDAS